MFDLPFGVSLGGWTEYVGSAKTPSAPAAFPWQSHCRPVPDTGVPFSDSHGRLAVLPPAAARELNTCFFLISFDRRSLHFHRHFPALQVARSSQDQEPDRLPGAPRAAAAAAGAAAAEAVDEEPEVLARLSSVGVPCPKASNQCPPTHTPWTPNATCQPVRFVLSWCADFAFWVTAVVRWTSFWRGLAHGGACTDRPWLSAVFSTAVH